MLLRREGSKNIKLNFSASTVKKKRIKKKRARRKRRVVEGE